jgi:hypothetical protein
MTDTAHKTLPQNIKDRALAAIAKITAWNAAVLVCRAGELLAHKPGCFEYELITDHAADALQVICYHGEQALDLLEAEARAQGWSPAAFYRAVGQERPAVLAQGPDVPKWRKAQR